MLLKANYILSNYLNYIYEQLEKTHNHKSITKEFHSRLFNIDNLIKERFQSVPSLRLRLIGLLGCKLTGFFSPSGG